MNLDQYRHLADRSSYLLAGCGRKDIVAKTLLCNIGYQYSPAPTGYVKFSLVEQMTKENYELSLERNTTMNCHLNATHNEKFFFKDHSFTCLTSYARRTHFKSGETECLDALKVT